MDVFDLADNLRAEFQEKGLSNEEFLLKSAETYDIKRVFDGCTETDDGQCTDHTERQDDV